jgi:hypothetical protein
LLTSSPVMLACLVFSSSLLVHWCNIIFVFFGCWLHQRVAWSPQGVGRWIPSAPVPAIRSMNVVSIVPPRCSRQSSTRGSISNHHAEKVDHCVLMGLTCWCVIRA